MSVPENTPDGTVILEGAKVIAIDDDAGGEVKFDIDWENTQFLKDGVPQVDSACALRQYVFCRLVFLSL